MSMVNGEEQIVSRSYSDGGELSDNHRLKLRRRFSFAAANRRFYGITPDTYTCLCAGVPKKSGWPGFARDRHSVVTQNNCQFRLGTAAIRSVSAFWKAPGPAVSPQ
jgi:hypothetical protein